MLSSVYHLAILNNVPTAIFSLEMSSEQLVERLESITSQVPLKRLRTNNLNLSGCDNLTNVSMLGNVHTLDLSACDNLTDVSKLGNVIISIYRIVIIYRI